MDGRTKTEKRFIEGKGWEIIEVPINGNLASVPPAGKPGTKIALIGGAGSMAPPTLTFEQVQALAQSLGLVVVVGDDYRDNLARIDELEHLLDNASRALAEHQPGIIPPGTTPAKGKGKGKGKCPDEAPIDADLVQAIAEAADLEQLTAIMQTVEDPELLKLADLRAEELKGA